MVLLCKNFHRQKLAAKEDFARSPGTTPVGLVVDVEDLDVTGEEVDSVPATPTKHTQYRSERVSVPRAGTDMTPEKCFTFFYPSNDKLPPLPACVTKLLPRQEMFSDPKALDAIRAEGQALGDAETWSLDSVSEKHKPKAWSQRTGNPINHAELMAICSVKFWERDPLHHKYKGRICFRGDNTRDEHGALAVFQKLSASPASIHTANSNIVYGCIPGHTTTQANAVRAYVQALLKAKCAKWVQIPKEFWPAEWKGVYEKPMCLFKNALYGHLESGVHCERHSEEAVRPLMANLSRAPRPRIIFLRPLCS